MTGAVVERDPELAALADAVEAAAGSHGSVVAVSGEAGIGKSSLVEALGKALPADARLLVGHCDDLATPRLLGPLRDLAGAVGAELSRALREPGDRDRLCVALRRELDWGGHATVLVVEDVQWADDATLDVLGYLVRRLATLPALLVLTHRDGIATRHPLRRLLAVADSSGTVRRLRLRPLTAEAVAELCRGGGHASTDPGRLHALTGGNPFFVHEVLATPGDFTSGLPSGAAAGVPASVVDSVLARLADLDDAERDTVHQLSVMTAALDRTTVEALVPGGLGALAAAEARGLLEVTPSRVRFRHELTRRAIRDALPVARRAVLEARSLAVLEALPAPDPALLVHHAAQAGDVAAIVRLGPVAARSASAGGAHREAAAHYRLVLAHRERFEPVPRAELLEASAVEGYAVGLPGQACLEDMREAVTLRRTLGHPVALGVSLRWLSRIAWWCGDRPSAEAAGVEAVAVLEEAGDRHALAVALSNHSQLCMLAERRSEAVTAAERAIGIARDLDARPVLCHALNNLGTALMAEGDPRGSGVLQESLALAVRDGLSEDAARAHCNLAWNLFGQHRQREALPIIEAGIEHAEAAEQIGFWRYLHVLRGMVALTRGDWAAAAADARIGLDATDPIRCAALTLLGRVLVRTGQDAREVVDEAWTLAQRLDELQRTGPAASLVCEEAWLRGDLDAVRRVGGPVHAEAARLRVPSPRAELGLWLSLAGQPVQPDQPHQPDQPEGAGHPFALMVAGRATEAARWWEEAGYPYERALALVGSEDEATVLQGLAQLDALGAAPAARLVRARLRERGVTGVPRGPQAGTRTHPAGLTPRQADVLDLLGQDLSNAEIAARLVLSVRTVDHHVAAVLTKLGAPTRREAADLARDSGWTPTRP